MMLSTELSKLVAPFKLIASRTALAPLYRVVEIAPDHLMACSSFALLHMHEVIDVNEVVHVDAPAFLAVVASLPSGQPIKLTAKAGVLSWTCGQAKGRLACIPPPEMPPLPADRTGRASPTSNALGVALDLGALSCSTNALGAPGTYGVVLDNDNQVVCATDNSTLSAYELPTKLQYAPSVLTLPPPAAALLASIVRDAGTLECTDREVIYRDEATTCVLRPVPPLKADVRSIRNQYSDPILIATLPKERITKFVNQITALAENRANARVLLGAGDGRVSLSFEEGAATSDEWFLADGLEGFPAMAPVSVSAAKMVRALSHTTEIALDFIDRGVIMLRGGSFSYLVSGQTK
jgi:hypothetical protein